MKGTDRHYTNSATTRATGVWQGRKKGLDPRHNLILTLAIHTAPHSGHAHDSFWLPILHTIRRSPASKPSTRLLRDDREQGLCFKCFTRPPPIITLTHALRPAAMQYCCVAWRPLAALTREVATRTHYRFCAAHTRLSSAVVGILLLPTAVVQQQHCCKFAYRMCVGRSAHQNLPAKARASQPITFCF